MRNYATENVGDKPHCDKPSSCSPQMQEARPMRETFACRLDRIIAQKRTELQALEDLQKHVSLMKEGSPLEELMWSLCRNLC